MNARGEDRTTSARRLQEHHAVLSEGSPYRSANRT
jgi:hypothetical protein